MGKSRQKRRPIDIASDAAYRGLIVAAVAAPVWRYVSARPGPKQKRPGRAGRHQQVELALDGMLRNIGAHFAGRLASAVVKKLVPERRPDSSDDSSFPSAHAAASAALAEAAAASDPAHASWWYGACGIVLALRATSSRHYPHDVLAGGLLGFLAARHGILRIAGDKTIRSDPRPRDPSTGRFAKRRESRARGREPSHMC